MKNSRNLLYFLNKIINERRIDKILHSHCILLINYAYGRINDIEHAKTIVDKAFVAAFKERSEFDGSDAILRFLFASVDDGCHTYCQELQQLQIINKLILSDKKNDWTKKDYKSGKKIIDAVMKDIENLPEQRQRIFRLFFCGLNTGEVAEWVARSKHTVLNQKRNAKNDLRRALQRRGPVPG